MADTLPASVTGTPTSSAEEPGKPPTREIGAVAQSVGSPGGWATFLDEAEYVPELTFPNSVLVYHRMRSDTQIEALHLGTTQPIREFRWMIDPNKADSKLVENVATDLGLPIKGEEADSGVKRAKGKFDFDTCLSDALLGPLYGFMDFEIVGRIEEALDWRMTKLSPRHPRTIQMFQQDDHGALVAIKQTFGPNFATTPAPIPAAKLLHLTWRPEAGTHVGRAMLRSMYREWLVKEKTMRIAVANLERAGGVPVIEGPQGASNTQLADLANMARQFKVAEGGGGAIPFGSKLNLVGGSTPDAIALLTYCDEAMARVWALMLVQLGQTQTGSRALGGEFAIYAARAQRLMGKWIATAFNNFLDRYTEWNDPLADYAPLLVFEPSQPEGLSVTDLVSLVDAGVLTVDPELEEWMRAEFSLPDKPEAEDIGQLTDAERALILNSRNPPPVAPGQAPAPGQVPPGSDPYNPAYHATPGPRKALDPTSISPTIAKTGTRDIPRIVGGMRASLTLPDRVLRREPTPNEIHAAVDFRSLDQAHATAVASLHHDYVNGTLPTQIGHLADQIRGGVAPKDLKAPVVRLDQLTEHLKTAAHSGVEAAVREAQVQGVPFNEADVVSAHMRAGARAERQAEHVANLNANGLTLGAQRRAGRLTSKVRSRETVAKDLEAHLTAQKHVFERENLRGAVTVAQNGGRFEAMQQVDPAVATASYEASEILDDRTCGPCEAIDGTQYEDLDEAEADYSGGGYVDCEGGPNCRGTIVATYGEQNPVGGEGDLREAEPAYTGGGPEELPPPDEPTPPDTPEGPPPEPTPVTPEPKPVAEPGIGPLLAKAQQITTHDEAVAFLKHEVGIPGEVEFGPKLEKAATGKYKPGSQGELNQQHAMDFIRQLAESVADARDTFGEASRVDNIVSNTRAREVYRQITHRAKGKALGPRALAAIRTWPTLGRNELIFNDGRSFEQLTAKDVSVQNGGYTSKATTDPRGIIMHEMGHSLENGLPGLASAFPRMLADSGLASTAQARGMAPFISQYAATVPAETWAESFATLMRPGGVADDFSYTGTNERIRELYPDADAKTKEALGKLRDNFNAWLDEHHPDTPHMPER